MIHQYKSNGYNIVMDVNSGSVHVVDDIVYDMIPLVEPLVTEGIKDADTIKAAVLNLANIPYPQEEITEAVDEVLELDAQFRASKGRGDELRQQRNTISKEIGKLMSQGKKDEAQAVSYTHLTLPTIA